MVKNVLKELENAIIEKDCRVCLEVTPNFNEIAKHEDNNINQLVLKQYYIEFFKIISSIVPTLIINPEFLLENDCEMLLNELAKEAKKEGLIVIADFRELDIKTNAKYWAEKYLGKESSFDMIVLKSNQEEHRFFRYFVKQMKKNGKYIWLEANNLQSLNYVTKIGKSTKKDSNGYNGIGVIVAEDIRDIRFFTANNFLILTQELIDIDTFDEKGLGAVIRYQYENHFQNSEWVEKLAEYIKDHRMLTNNFIIN